MVAIFAVATFARTWASRIVAHVLANVATKSEPAHGTIAEMELASSISSFSRAPRTVASPAIVPIPTMVISNRYSTKMLASVSYTRVRSRRATNRRVFVSKRESRVL